MAFMNIVKMQLFYSIGDIMDIKKYPQYQLYLFTLKMLMFKDQLIPKN